MEISPVLIQFLGSLVAILALAGLAFWLKLGPAPQLVDDDAVRDAASHAYHDFSPTRIARDREGRGAIVSDAAGRVLVLRPHGSHFAGRLLSPAARAHLEGEELVIDTAERRFGQARLCVADADGWRDAING